MVESQRLPLPQVKMDLHEMEQVFFLLSEMILLSEVWMGEERVSGVNRCAHAPTEEDCSYKPRQAARCTKDKLRKFTFLPYSENLMSILSMKIYIMYTYTNTLSPSSRLRKT